MEKNELASGRNADRDNNECQAVPLALVMSCQRKIDLEASSCPAIQQAVCMP